MAVKIRRILVAVRDPARTPRSMLHKAAALARGSGARVELFHAISEPVAALALRRGRSKSNAQEHMSEIATRTVRQLERAARAVFPPQVRWSAHAEWDYPPHEAIVRRVRATRTDLVIAAVQPHRTGGRLLLANTDWELIRHCPCPVLLVKSTRAYERPGIVVSLDPFHAHAKPASLDRRLLEAAGAVADALGGELHAFHAHLPLAAMIPFALSQPVPVALPAEAEAEHTKRLRAAFDDLAKSARIPPARRHFMVGSVADTLDAVLRRTRASIVVMGAVSRSGLKRVFIGSTAEELLDRLPCDVLVVKPQGFEADVPAEKPSFAQRII